jgi:hypothetical protein
VVSLGKCERLCLVTWDVWRCPEEAPSPLVQIYITRLTLQAGPVNATGHTHCVPCKHVLGGMHVVAAHSCASTPIRRAQAATGSTPWTPTSPCVYSADRPAAPGVAGAHLTGFRQPEEGLYVRRAQRQQLYLPPPPHNPVRVRPPCVVSKPLLRCCSSVLTHAYNRYVECARSISS